MIVVSTSCVISSTYIINFVYLCLKLTSLFSIFAV